jgi:hypothetical protein
MKMFKSLVLLSALAISPLFAQEKKNDSDDYREVYKQLVNRNASAVVTVKYVLSMTASGNEDRREDRAQGVIVGKDGLILVTDRAVSIDLSAFAGGRAGGASMVAKSSEFRVQMQGEEEWHEADLVTRDPSLGVAWLRLQKAPKAMTHVDLTQHIKPEPGMVFNSLLRTSDALGGVIVWRPGLILGQTTVPKTRFLVDGVPGLAFDNEGRVMGWVDIDFDSLLEGRNRAGLSGDVSNVSLHMVGGDRVAAATARAAKMPSVKTEP